MSALNLSTKYIKNQDVIFKETPDKELFLILINNDQFYLKIDGLAVNIWKNIEKCDEEKGVIVPQEVLDQCLKELNPPADLFAKDFERFYNELIKLELVSQK